MALLTLWDVLLLQRGSVPSREGCYQDSRRAVEWRTGLGLHPREAKDGLCPVLSCLCSSNCEENMAQPQLLSLRPATVRGTEPQQKKDGVLGCGRLERVKSIIQNTCRDLLGRHPLGAQLIVKYWSYVFCFQYAVTNSPPGHPQSMPEAGSVPTAKMKKVVKIAPL